jgi:hypothetical protein
MFSLDASHRSALVYWGHGNEPTGLGVPIEFAQIIKRTLSDRRMYGQSRPMTSMCVVFRLCGAHGIEETFAPMGHHTRAHTRA